MPTTKPRYTFTDAGHVAQLLDAAERRWPNVADRKMLLLRLAEEGHNALASVEAQVEAEDRAARQTEALKRIRSRIDRELLLSDRAWS